MSARLAVRNAIHEVEHVWIDMPDGIRLSARLWLPEDAETVPVPAILEYIPYRKRDMVRIRDERNHAWFASYGYASVRVDIRGSGDSEGVMPDMYSIDELDDAGVVIDWISRQKWCDGKVGMMGTSWGGTASLQAAAERPPALKAVIAVCSTDNRFDDDIHHMGGCLLTDTVEWGATLPAILASPPDPASVGEGWRDVWMQRLDALEFPLENWIRHESRDSYWRWGSVNETPGAIRCPVLAVGGWVDRYSNTVMNLLADTPDNCWGIVGPWAHHYPDLGRPGPAICFQQEALRWWDHWLKGHDNGIDRKPRLRAWMQSYTSPREKLETRPGRWIAEADWPGRDIEPETWYLADRNLSRTNGQEPAQKKVPWDLEVGAAAGDTGYFGRAGGLPVDQSGEDERSLVFETESLVTPVEILGAPVFSFTFTVDGKRATIVARLNDVSPSGEVARVSYGMQNLALNRDGTVPDRIPNGEERSSSITMHNTAYRFEAGHRIRLAVSCTYWPMIWPSPEPFYLTLVTGKSALTLPVRPAVSGDDEISMPEPVVPPGFPKSIPLAAPDLTRVAQRDIAGNTSKFGWHQDFICVRHETIGVDFGFETEACHTIGLDDPLSAVSRFDHRMHFTREDGQVDVYSFAQLSSDADEYRVEGSIRVEENGAVIFERHWSPRIKRCWS